MKTSNRHPVPPYVMRLRVSGRASYRVVIPARMISEGCPIRSGLLATSYEKAIEKYDRSIRPALIAFRRRKTISLVSSRP